MKNKNIILILAILIVLPMVVAETPTNIVWFQETNNYGNVSHTFTNINTTFNGRTKTFTYPPKSIYEQRFSYEETIINVTLYEEYDTELNITVRWNTTEEETILVIPEVSDANYTSYINQTFYEDYTYEYNLLMEKQNQTFDSKVTFQNVQILGNITGGSPVKIKGGIQLVDYNYEGDNKIKDIFNRIKTKFLEISQRLTTVEADIQQIKDNGYTGTCPNGVIVNNGIVTGCA